MSIVRTAAPSPLSGAAAVTEYWLRTWRETWLSTVVINLIGPAVYLAAMGLGLGSLVDSHSGPVAGLSYLAFIAPGLLAANAMQQGADIGSFPVMGGLVWQRHFEAMSATSLRALDQIGGLAGYAVVRLTITSALFLGVAAIFGAIGSWWGLLAVPVAVLTGLAVTLPIAAWTAHLDNEAWLTLILRLIVIPMFLFSGTFFPISQLPTALQPVAQVLPLWHGVEVCRALTSGAGLRLADLGHLGYLLVWVGAGASWATWQLTRRLYR